MQNLIFSRVFILCRMTKRPKHAKKEVQKQRGPLLALHLCMGVDQGDTVASSGHTPEGSSHRARVASRNPGVQPSTANQDQLYPSSFPTELNNP